MGNQLALIQPNDYNTMSLLAKVAAQSGYSGKNEVQAMFVMLKGFEIGISPMQALDGITVISGKTTVSPQLMLALINRSGELEDMKIESTDTECKVSMTRKGRSEHTEIFTMKDAVAMQLAGRDNWKKQPKVMLKWRAVSACARVVFPDVIQGMYTPEEMGVEVIEDEGGNVVIEAEVKAAENIIEMAALPAPAPQAVVDTSTGEIMDAPQPAPAVVTPTPERERDPLENEEVTITRVTYWSGGKLREHWKGHATFARPGESSVPVEIDIWEEDRKVLEVKGYPFPKTFRDGDMYIPVVIRKDRGMRRINLDALPARQMTPPAPPEARHPSLDEKPKSNPFNGALVQSQEAAPETAQKPTSKEPDWFQKTLKEQFGLFKTYAQEHIYGTNLYHMKGSLKKHGVVDAKDKLTPAWENKTIGEAVKLLNDLRQHEQMEKAS